MKQEEKDMQEIYRKITVELHDYCNEELVELFQTTQQEVYFKELMVRNSGIIRSIAISYSIDSYFDLDDLMSIGYEELWRATKYYKNGKGAKFTTFFSKFVRQKYNRLYDSANKVKRKTDEPVLSYDNLEDINKERGEADDYSHLFISEFFKGLTGVTKEVAELLSRGFSKGDIAKALECTPATVSYYVKRIQTAYTAYAGEM